MIAAMYVAKPGQQPIMPMLGEVKDTVTVLPNLHNQDHKRTTLGTGINVLKQLDLLEERNVNLSWLSQQDNTKDKVRRLWSMS